MSPQFLSYLLRASGFYSSSKAANPGKSLPLRYASAAPPPLERWLMDGADPLANAASIESPPAITVVAVECAIALIRL